MSLLKKKNVMIVAYLMFQPNTLIEITEKNRRLRKCRNFQTSACVNIPNDF